MIDKKCDILLVDDDQVDVELFKLALLEAYPDITMCWLARGDEAVKFVRREGQYRNMSTPKVVVMDINMPGQNGLEILTTIKQDPQLALTPVIMRSNNSRPDVVARAYSLGANVFFPKLSGLDESIEQVRLLVHHWLRTASLPNVASAAAFSPVRVIG